MYGTGVFDFAFITLYMGTRYVAQGAITHDQIAFAQTLGGFACATSDTTCRIIIGVDEETYAKDFAGFHFVEAGFGYISAGAGMAAAALNAADQPYGAVAAKAVDKVTFLCFAVAAFTELEWRYDPARRK